LSDLAADTLLVNEIFASIQGESTHAGRPCTFVRLTACNLRCGYCDTTYAFMKGKRSSVAQVVAEVQRLGLPLVELTGGEPMLQPATPVLLTTLCDAGFEVLLETNGSVALAAVDRRVKKIIDWKAPSSGEAVMNLDANIAQLLPHDEVKFVLASRADYDWARAEVARLPMVERGTVVFGPVFGALSPRDLAAWLVADRLPVRMQLQLHKLIWDPRARGV